MKHGTLFAAIAITGLIHGVNAARADDELPRSLIETTVFAGYRLGGSFDETVTNPATSVTTQESARFEDGNSLSIAVNWEAEPGSYYELSYSKFGGTLNTTTVLPATPAGPGGTPPALPDRLAALPVDMDVEYVLIGGYTTFADEKARMAPYFLLTVGAARFTPDSSAFEDATKFAAAIGGGVKYRITKHFGVRFDARVYAAFFENQSDVFCNAATTCAINLQGETLLQPEASLGLTAAF